AEPLFYSRRFADAEAALARAARLTPVGAEHQEFKQHLVYLYAVSGRRAEAIRVLDELTQRFERAREPLAASIAAIYTGLGNPQQAVSWLERAPQGDDLELW